ncbi:MAG: bifunctional 5,10-methylene-tetrahydrofolate dehydrogenase/5,10-methylene-tetrahydrofolate cyclohydrolase, partial [Bacteroidia bacterium]|nr:bifunctional 5,10-methylene-tetrahydrofolate dehydrogenase/5,10-methylene-tetrahydrofolate cyclohydrolase [Bacteroidia bacterium]
MELIDGKKTAAEMKLEMKSEVDLILGEGLRAPHLSAILVGNDGASETYVAHKIKTCKELGFESSLFRFPEDVSEAELLDKIKEVNNDDSIDGLIVQLPLPKHINSKLVTHAILPSKDVDGFHPVNAGNMMLEDDCFLAATPYGILMLLKRYKIDTEGKHCVVLGRSNIVGTPMSVLMSRNTYPGNCTVTICHSRTKNLKELCKQADIVIAALGKPLFVKSDMVKEGAVVIDVGITRIKSTKTKSGWKLVGDVDFDDVSPKCSYITPVP